MKKFAIFVGIVLLASICISAAAIVYNVLSNDHVSNAACNHWPGSATTPSYAWGSWWCNWFDKVKTYTGAAIGIAASQIGLTLTLMVACLIFRNKMEKRHHAYLGYIIFQLFLSIALIVVVLIPATDLWPESFTEIDWGWGTSLLSVAGYFLAILTLILHRRSEKAGEFV
ncbi:uncharacterized protein LOC110854719 [Folsomia candida]|uniref:uncharacterized protein LOC110854719 n=1 Tax=Folsomia candida TaxID=158441 RepID=UPI000B8F1821|nr:uncharacterized protein LOC110854719 [Folsomia candida]